MFRDWEKKRATTSQQLILAMSANAEDADVDTVIQAGANKFMKKPLKVFF